MALPIFNIHVDLDVACEDPIVVVPVKQLDHLTRILDIFLYNSTTQHEVTIDYRFTTAELHVQRPDGVLIVLPAKILYQTSSVNYASVELTDDCLAISGKALADLKIYEQGKIFSASSFVLDIQRTPVGKHSSDTGITTKANIEIISEDKFKALSVKVLNTLYIVKGKNATNFYLGEELMSVGSSGISSPIGGLALITTGSHISSSGTPSDIE